MATATTMAENTTRRSFTLKQKHIKWLRNKSKDSSLSQKFLVERAIEYYRATGEDNDKVVKAIKADKMDPPGAARGTKSKVFEIPDEFNDYIEDMRDDHGVNKSFVVRRAITTYANEGFDKDKIAKQMMSEQ